MFDLLKEVACIHIVGSSEEIAKEYGYDSWIDYCHKKNWFTRSIDICPICKKPFTKENYAVGGHVLAAFGKLDSEGKLIYTECVTPICNRCNVKAESQIKAFKVLKLRLCKVPPQK